MEGDFVAESRDFCQGVPEVFLTLAQTVASLQAVKLGFAYLQNPVSFLFLLVDDLQLERPQPATRLTVTQRHLQVILHRRDRPGLPL